jgi:hypothetical protein
MVEVLIPRRVDQSAASLMVKARKFCDENEIEFLLGKQLRGALVLETRNELDATVLEIGLA